jgi:hypothetical protein
MGAGGAVVGCATMVQVEAVAAGVSTVQYAATGYTRRDDTKATVAH